MLGISQFLLLQRAGRLVPESAGGEDVVR
jgi:hypothetical protein